MTFLQSNFIENIFELTATIPLSPHMIGFPCSLLKTRGDGNDEYHYLSNNL